MDWNILITSHRDEEEMLLSDLRDTKLGQFEISGFRDVIIGKVEDLGTFMEMAKRLYSISRVVPIGTSFSFDATNFVERLKKAVEPYAKSINPNESFCVRFTRRGLKGLISSQEVEREIGAYIQALVEKMNGEKPGVDLEHPDKIVVIETLGYWCGVGMITAELRLSYPFVRE